MSNRTIDFAGRKMILHPSGSIFWPDQATLIVGDLHFEKASWYHHTGQFLPPYDSGVTLKKLETVMSEFFPRRLILLGDVFHDNAAWYRMAQTDQEHLAKLLEGRETIYVNGNHDLNVTLPSQFSGLMYSLAGVTFRHIMDTNDQGPEISAHFHPIAIVKYRGTRIRRACFVHKKNRILLPAFGALTGGLDVNDPALKTFQDLGTQLYLLGSEAIFNIPREFAEK